MEQTNSVNADPDPTSESCTKRRNWTGFWVLGLCNNFAYVVMLSTAHDILKKQENQNSTAFATVTSTLDLQAGNSSNTSIYDCNPTSTAAVLLADILPTLFIKMFAPFVIHKFPYGFRILFCGLTAAASFLVVSFSSTLWMSFLGVILASISSGLGELSFLALTVYYSRDVVGGWGSGTGAAGVTGALMYSGLTQLGLTPRLTLLIMLIIPAAMVLNYFFLLVHPPSLPQWRTKDPRCTVLCSEETQGLMAEEEDEDKSSPRTGVRARGPLTCTEKVQVMKGLLKFVLPLGLVYFAEYFINQGLMELLYFPDFFLSHAEQYRWYQTLYQVGVFISRSSLCCFKVRKLWVFAALQFLNTVLLMFAVWFRFMPSAWIVFVIILYEGLLGGGAYVNTFYFISKETEERHREFAMALASVGDTMGICLSTALSFPVHNYFCTF
ncbi:battenin [Periophthalmus magnuspinnatus]|uniref:battenin n=1 Tax=Periophthalmus magnuspinnatus TaxID=409849 RepID=UPI00145A4BFD|nr:battenin [Periophthalmus magnuspinnatus]